MWLAPGGFLNTDYNDRDEKTTTHAWESTEQLEIINAR